MDKNPPPPPPYTPQNPPGFVVPPGQAYQPSAPGCHQMPPPPPQDYPQMPPPPQGGGMVIISTMGSVFGPDSVIVSCPYCHHQISTRVVSEASAMTHMFALILCLFGCIPCCLIPYCTDSCQRRNHYCPSCRAYLGVYTN